jgi:plastocyanin
MNMNTNPRPRRWREDLLPTRRPDASQPLRLRVLRPALAGLLAGPLAGSLLLAGAHVASAQQAADPAVIPIQSHRFLATPEQTVPAGTTVTWVNQDFDAHDVVANDSSFISPLIQPGESWSFTFTAPGSYAYMCDLHVGMEGVVTVVASASG